MNKEDVYTYFTLRTKVYESVEKWVRNKVKNNYYKNCPMSISSIANAGGGQIAVKVDFCVPPCNDYIEEMYTINIEDLQDY